MLLENPEFRNRVVKPDYDKETLSLLGGDLITIRESLIINGVPALSNEEIEDIIDAVKKGYWEPTYTIREPKNPNKRTQKSRAEKPVTKLTPIRGVKLDKLFQKGGFVFDSLEWLNKKFTPEGSGVFKDIFAFSITNDRVNLSFGKGLYFLMASVFNLVMIFIAWYTKLNKQISFFMLIEQNYAVIFKLGISNRTAFDDRVEERQKQGLVISGPGVC